MSGGDDDARAILGPVAALIGTWRGTGEGHYPTIDDFAYVEEVEIVWPGRHFLAYVQRTRHPGTDAPMHAEVGYVRPIAEGGIEFVLAHPTGVVEVEEGRVRVEGPERLVVELSSTSVATTATATRVRALRRTFVLEGDTLRYDLWMSHGATVDGHHLRATLERVRDRHPGA